jgi:hypothetical protein
VRNSRLSKGLLLTLLCLNVVNGQSRFAGTIPQIKIHQEQAPPLQLTVKIVGEEYCVGDSELDSLRLKVRLIYTNKARQKLILYKGSSLISRIMISRNFTDAAAKRFEVNSSLTHLSGAGSKCYNGTLPNNCFVILPPSAFYEAETVVGLFVVRGDAREITGAVKSGNHVLQVEVITWRKSNKMAKGLRARWRRYGTVWYEPITSVAVPFTVEKERKIADCP